LPNLSETLLPFTHRCRTILVQVVDFNRQHCQPLTDVVVELSPNPSTFLLLRFDQFSARIAQSGFHLLVAGDVNCKDQNPALNILRSHPRANLPLHPHGAMFAVPAVLMSANGFSG
jgi:hypothetical protein